MPGVCQTEEQYLERIWYIVAVKLEILLHYYANVLDFIHICSSEAAHLSCKKWQDSSVVECFCFALDKILLKWQCRFVPFVYHIWKYWLQIFSVAAWFLKVPMTEDVWIYIAYFCLAGHAVLLPILLIWEKLNYSNICSVNFGFSFHF